MEGLAAAWAGVAGVGWEVNPASDVDSRVVAVAPRRAPLPGPLPAPRLLCVAAGRPGAHATPGARGWQGAIRCVRPMITSPIHMHKCDCLATCYASSISLVDW